MKFAVLCAPNSWYFRDLSRAAGHRHQIAALPFSVLESHVDGIGVSVSAADQDLRDYEAVLVRTMPPGSLEQVVFRMDALGRIARSGIPVINSQRAIETAVDKYLATAKLQEAGLDVPTTVACQSVEAAMSGFEHLGRDVVVKPLFGGEGRGIFRVTDEDLAVRAFKALAQLNAVIYLQPFVDHEGFDVRLFVLDDQVFSIRRRNHRDWRTNVSRGAEAEAYAADEELVEIARRSAHTVGARIAGVDILLGRDGRKYVLEVNAVPGWRALARTLEIDIAERLLEFMEKLVHDQE